MRHPKSKYGALEIAETGIDLVLRLSEDKKKSERCRGSETSSVPIVVLSQQ
jgi:hypothetical protein